MSAAAEILATLAAAPARVPAAAWLACAAAPLLVLLRTRHETISATRRIRFLLLAVVVAGGLLLAWQSAWVCDDAYISFRYARNLAEGHGLVFNPGERVEGYTNFLWTVLLAGGIALGVHPAVASVAMGLAAYAALIVGVHRLVQRLAGKAAAPAPAGIAPLLVAGTALVASHATSGLETMLTTALTVFAFERAEADRPLLAGLLAILATMSHPDHALFYAAIGASLLLRRAPLRSLAAHAAPFALLYAPYFAWRWHYYGDFVPNTFHAKSADLPYFSQGGIYLLVGALSMGLWAVLPLAGAGAWASRRSRFTIACLLGLPIFLAYTARIGGDFMLGRLLVTPAALLAIWAGAGFESLLARRAPVAAALLGALALVALLPLRIVEPGEKRWHVSDEASFYPLLSLRPPRVGSRYAREAEVLRTNLVDRGLAPMLATDCVGIVGWETRLPIFDLFGLTSREVAVTPIFERGRPGHEKYGSPGQILEAGAELSRIPVFPPPYERLTLVALEELRYHLTRFAPPLGEELASRGQTRDARRLLATWASQLAQRSPEQRACDAWFAREYYFRHHPPDELSREWASSLGLTLPDAEALLVRGRTPAELGWERVGGFAFDDGLAGWTSEGSLKDAPASSHAVPGQEEVFPRSGAFVSSLPSLPRDAEPGHALSPPFTIQGDVLTHRIGGRGPGQALRLLVDGVAVRESRPCQCDLLRDDAWDVRELRGATGRIELVDGGHGYVVADEIAEWRSSP